ncbi:MAG: radical SAM protein [Bryobacteraceae bacterium]
MAPQSHENLVGIARLAATADVLESKRRVEYHLLPTRRFISKCPNEKLPFQWTINPYRGCEFGCKYCYARYTHEFMELREGRQFEEQIYAKQWNPDAFRQELRKVPLGDGIAIGTATDPYQPAERRFGITREMLRVIAGEGSWRVWITTKSDLVVRDIDLLRQAMRRNSVGVMMTVTTLDEKLARALEPYAPRPALRIDAVRRLREAGIPAGVGCSPILPLINDSERGIEGVARAAATAGALRFHANLLFLSPSSYAVFLPFLEEYAPALVRRYIERYSQSAYLKGEYPKWIAERVAAIRSRHGFAVRHEEFLPEAWSTDTQLSLFEVDKPALSQTLPEYVDKAI